MNCVQGWARAGLGEALGKHGGVGLGEEGGVVGEMVVLVVRRRRRRHLPERRVGC